MMSPYTTNPTLMTSAASLSLEHNWQKCHERLVKEYIHQGRVRESYVLERCLELLQYSKHLPKDGGCLWHVFWAHEDATSFVKVLGHIISLNVSVTYAAIEMEQRLQESLKNSNPSPAFLDKLMEESKQYPLLEDLPRFFINYGLVTPQYTWASLGAKHFQGDLMDHLNETAVFLLMVGEIEKMWGWANDPMMTDILYHVAKKNGYDIKKYPVFCAHESKLELQEQVKSAKSSPKKIM